MLQAVLWGEPCRLVALNWVGGATAGAVRHVTHQAVFGLVPLVSYGATDQASTDCLWSCA